MSAKLISVEGKKVRIELTIELSESMLDSEDKIQEGLNEAGRIATTEALKQQDTDGSVLEVRDKKWRTKGVQPKSYQTVYGEVISENHGRGVALSYIQRLTEAEHSASPRREREL